MFKNSHIQVKLAKDSNEPTDADVRPAINLEEISHVAKDLTKHVAIAIIAVMGAAFVFGTAHDVIVNNTDPEKDQND